MASLTAGVLAASSGSLQPLQSTLAIGDVGQGTAELMLAVTKPGNGPSGGSPLFSRDQAVSADGRWVAFASDADDLVDNDTNKTRDMFLRDLSAGVTIRIPWLRDVELPSDLEAGQPTIDAHGEVIAFTVKRTGYPIYDVDDLRFPLIAIYDRNSETTSILEDSGQAIGIQPSISWDGRWVAYTSLADGAPKVVVVGLPGGSGRVISAGVAESAQNPSISGDGRYVAFSAPAAEDGFGYRGGSQVYRVDVASGELVLVSVIPEGAEADGGSYSPAISEDGSTVAFASTATNLAADPGLDGTSQVYAWQQETGRVRLVSTDRTGAAGRGSSGAPAVSGGGRFVAFQSSAPDLGPVTGLPGSGALASPAALQRLRFTDVFVRDLVNGQLAAVSVDAEGRPARSDSGRPSISGDGMVVVYDSTSSGLIGGDTNDARDVFFRVWSPQVSLAPDPLDLGSAVIGSDAKSGTATVIGGGWAPTTILSVAIVGPEAGDFSLSGDSCVGSILYFSETCAIGVSFSPSGDGQRTATLVVEDSAPGSPHSIRLTGTGVTTATATPSPAGPSPSVSTPGPQGPGGGPVSQPTLMLDPPVGPPGFVTTAIGSGFPAGARVRLRWDPNLPPATDVVVEAVDGSFRVGVLVFPKSATGQRVLVAVSDGGPGFADTPADFLVVTGSAQPPASGAVTFVSPEVEPIILR